MHIALSRDQEAFGLECRRMLAKECPPSLVRAVATPAGCGHSPQLHGVLAAAGWLEMAAAEPGTDDAGTLFDLGIARREAGRVLVPTTLHTSVLAALVLRRCPPSALVAGLRAAIGAGSSLATLAYLERDAATPEEAARYRTRVRREGEHWLLDGVKTFVLNAGTADVLLVAAVVADVRPARVGLLLLDAGSPGVEIRELATFGHDAQAEVTFTDVRLDLHAMVAGPFEESSWVSWFGRPLDEATALLCMEMLGGLERVIEDTVDYVNRRVVFDRPVGSFQAVQHMLANAAVAATAGRVAALQAAWTVSVSDDGRREVSVAKSWLARAYKDTTLVAHQLFGGAGYVRDADLHLWSQRAKATEPLLGGRTYHLRRLADLGSGSLG